MSRAFAGAPGAGGAAGAGESGSVFIEALVALALLALVLGAVCRILADSAVRHGQVSQRLEALMVARSALSAVGSAAPLAPGAVEGQDGDDVWRIDMQPCGSGAVSAGPLYCVTVAVRDVRGGAPLAVLSTRRLAPRAR